MSTAHAGNTPLSEAVVECRAAALAWMTWENPGYPQAWAHLVDEFGVTDAWRIWVRAATLLEDHAPRTRHTAPSTLPVLTLAGVDHDPVPDGQATCCGLATNHDPSDLTPPQGEPCHDCGITQTEPNGANQ